MKNWAALYKVIFEGDSLLVVNEVCREAPCWRNCGQLIEDSRVHLQGFWSQVVCHVKRAANQVARVCAS